MGFPCNCITVSITTTDGSFSYDLEAAGEYNGRNYYEFTEDGDTYHIYWNGVDAWVFTNAGLGGIALAFLEHDVDCPDVYDWKFSAPITRFVIDARECCTIMQERIEETYNIVRLPEVFEEENRGYFRCCCPFNVLASDGETWQNDITSAWIKLSSNTDTASATLYKNGQPTAYNTSIQIFPNDVNAYYWTVNWYDVLLSDGVGCYQLKIQYNISGIIGEFTWGIYNLREFSIQNALKTARLRVKFNSYHEIEGINFTGANVEDTIRFFGFIGYRQPNMEIDNLIYKNREVKKVKRENLNTYEIITDPTCEEHIKKLTDLYLLSENELYISDYNAHNHSYRYQDLPAIVEESPELNYYDFSREASLRCIVGDKKKDKRSFYNGGLGLLGGGGQQGPLTCAPAAYTVEYQTQGVIQSGLIPSGGSETIVVPDVTPCPDTDIEVNGVAEGSVVAGSTVDVQLFDSIGTVTPLSVTQSGNEFLVELPDAPPCPPAVTRSTATLMKTGQTTSYRTGDDGDIEAGRATNFLTLDAAPLHNDGSPTINTTTNRFTDTLGGQTYANNIVLDWSTWNGSTLLGYHKNANSALTWNNAIDTAAAYSVGTFTSGWRLANKKEMLNLFNYELNQVLNYSPFNHVGDHFTSTTSKASTTFAFVCGGTIGDVYRIGKTSAAVWKQVRTFSLSTSNVLS